MKKLLILILGLFLCTAVFSQTKYLIKGGGTRTLSQLRTDIGNATSSQVGLMSAVDKQKLDSLYNGDVRDSVSYVRIIGAGEYDTLKVFVYYFPTYTTVDSTIIGWVPKPGGGVNIFNSNGQATANRVFIGNGKTLNFNNFVGVTFDTSKVTIRTSTGFDAVGDSLFNVFNGGIHTSRGVRHDNLPYTLNITGKKISVIDTANGGTMYTIDPALIGGGGISGLTTNELVYGNSATTIASLPVATYPSLTELSYVKGLTSAAQTQINTKFNTADTSVITKDYTTQITGKPTFAQIDLTGIVESNGLVYDGTKFIKAPSPVDSIYRKAGQDSIFYRRYGIEYAIKDSVGSGGGSGVTTMAAIGSSPNANGATISGSNLNLEPASASFGGVVTTGTQTIAGAKTFSSAITTPTITAGQIHYSGTGGLLSGTDNFYWLNSNNRLFIDGASNTGAPVTIRRNLSGVYSFLKMNNSSDAATGGYIDFGDAVSTGFAPYAIYATDNTDGVATYHEYRVNDGATSKGAIYNVTNQAGSTALANASAKLYQWRSNGTAKMTMDVNGKIGIGTASPTAFLHLPAVTATAATASAIVPEGTLMTTPENGAIEAASNHIYWTSGGTRLQLDNETATESTYTPTLTNTTNIDASTAYTINYTRRGDEIHVWGEVDIDATALLTVCEMGLSLPVASTISTTRQLAGTGAFEDGTTVQIKGDTSNGRAMFRFTPLSTSNNKYSFHFTYKFEAP
jgi:hypothetical protein